MRSGAWDTSGRGWALDAQLEIHSAASMHAGKLEIPISYPRGEVDACVLIGAEPLRPNRAGQHAQQGPMRIETPRNGSGKRVQVGLRVRYGFALEAQWGLPFAERGRGYDDLAGDDFPTTTQAGTHERSVLFPPTRVFAFEREKPGRARL